MELVSWMYLNLRVDVHSGTRTEISKNRWCLALESRTRFSFCLVFVSWMFLHLRVDVHFVTQLTIVPKYLLDVIQ
ncbi:unnamed protein product [Schistosoma mattheei]|uniref:Uncharacterized protein n=1 Tax=Schistosoma mattheei TaxID=31246 RepID=A0A3P8FM25_9TREM|nr:unnamed protein product [Schistosoma mattheei]